MLRQYKKDIAWATGSTITGLILPFLFPVLLIPFNAMPRKLLSIACIALTILTGLLVTFAVISFRRFNGIHRLYYPNERYPDYFAEKEVQKGFNDKTNDDDP